MLNNRLKLLRNTLHLKQNDFAKRISTTQGHISDIENGRKDLSDRIIKLICLEFNVNENWLRTGEGEMFLETNGTLIDQFVKEYRLNPFAKKMLETYIELTEEQQNVITDYFKSLIAKVKTSEEMATTIDKNSSDMDIEEELNKYRLELEAEQKGKTSKVSENLDSKNMA